jgi:N-acetylneuraminic acid mutarotase
MPPQKRRRTVAASSSSSAHATVVLTGGRAEKPATISKFRDGRLCDVQLQAADGTTTFSAHALCLSAASGYFDALYAGSDWADASGAITMLPEVPAHALEACLEFIYAGEATIGDAAHLPAVLAAAAYLQIPEMLAAAEATMTSHLGPTTALHTWQIADRHGFATLAAAAAAAAARHFAAVVASEAWVSAPIECVRELLRADRLVVANETQVYDAAVAWLRAQTPPIGAEDAAALLGLVRFPLLSRDFMKETVRTEPLLKTPAGLEMLVDVLQASTFGDTTRRRIGFERIYVFGGCSTMECYDPATNTWEVMAPSGGPPSFHHCGATVYDGKIYVIGGYDSDLIFVTNSAKVNRYDPATNAWEAMASMETQRRLPGVAVIDGKIYAAGGYGARSGVGNEDTSFQQTVEQYTPETNTWKAVAPMAAKRYAPAAAVINGKLYVAGGLGAGAGASAVLNTVERYDPATNTWDAVASMGTARCRAGSAVLDGKLYVFGGRSRPGGAALDTVERYDPTSGAWEALASMVMKRLDHAGTVIDGKLYAIGGCQGDNDTVERYDPNTNTWEVMAPLTVKRKHPVCGSM